MPVLARCILFSLLVTSLPAIAGAFEMISADRAVTASGTWYATFSGSPEFNAITSTCPSSFPSSNSTESTSLDGFDVSLNSGVIDFGNLFEPLCPDAFLDEVSCVGSAPAAASQTSSFSEAERRIDIEVNYSTSAAWCMESMVYAYALPFTGGNPVGEGQATVWRSADAESRSEFVFSLEVPTHVEISGLGTLTAGGGYPSRQAYQALVLERSDGTLYIDKQGGVFEGYFYDVPVEASAFVPPGIYRLYVEVSGYANSPSSSASGYGSATAIQLALTVNLVSSVPGFAPSGLIVLAVMIGIGGTALIGARRLR